MSGTAPAAPPRRAAAVAVGVFDGLHLGHRRILDRTRELARMHAGDAAVVTFDPHPDVVLSRRFQPLPPLTPLPEKQRRLAVLGIEDLCVLPFTRELAGIGPEEFVERFLVAPFGLRALVVGGDFALGKGRAGNIERLAAIGATHGFEVHAIPLLEIDGRPVNSTRIRTLLEAGAVAEAAALLGRRYDLAGHVVTGDGLGRTLGCPTANLRLEDEKLLPGDGVYAAWARLAADGELRPAALSIGVKPTFGGQARAIEVHLLDWSGDLVGRELTVECAEWLRPQVRFDGMEALRLAIADDLLRVRRHLGVAAASGQQP